MAGSLSNDSNIPVNVKILKHVEIEIEDSSIDSNDWKVGLNTYSKLLNNSMDPSERINNYKSLRKKVNVNTNTNVVIKTYFNVDENFMDQNFYNNNYTLNNIISGAVSFYAYGSWVDEGVPLPITSNELGTQTTYNFEINGSSGNFDIYYNMKIKFTDDNWWKILAGEHTIGQIVVTVEAQ